VDAESAVVPPESLRGEGRELWRDVLSVYELTAPERRLLAVACATVDTIADLDDVVSAEGVTAEGSKGQTVCHPAVAEARQQRLALGRLLAQLALPDPEGGVVRSPTQLRGSAAARQRWRIEDRKGAV
jgi:hypothetical protein